jgi:hypothetical protein
MSTRTRAEQVMNAFFDKLGPGPYYYDNVAVAAALRESTEGIPKHRTEPRQRTLRRKTLFHQRTTFCKKCDFKISR